MAKVLAGILTAASNLIWIVRASPQQTLMSLWKGCTTCLTWQLQRQTILKTSDYLGNFFINHFLKERIFKCHTHLSTFQHENWTPWIREKYFFSKKFMVTRVQKNKNSWPHKFQSFLATSDIQHTDSGLIKASQKLSSIS